MRNRSGRRRQSPKAGRTGGGIVAEGQPGGGAGRGDPGVSKLLITNILMRLIEEPRPAPLPPPLALKLVNEPLANTQHYDRLREKSHTD